MARFQPVVAVDLLHVGGSVGVGLFKQLASFWLTSLQQRHGFPDPELLAGQEEDAQRIRAVAQDVGTAAPDDHGVAFRRLLDDLLGQPKHRPAQVKGRIRIGWRPGRHVLRRREVDGGELAEEPVEE